MSVFDVLRVLSTLGKSISTVGNLMARIGFALSSSNLGDGQGDPIPDQLVSSQDLPTQGVKDEKPVEQERFL
jgi:hypothetical protein